MYNVYGTKLVRYVSVRCEFEVLVWVNVGSEIFVRMYTDIIHIMAV